MKYPKYCVDHFLKEEGLELEAYVDTRGYWTVGIGHMLGKSDEYASVTVTEEQAYAMLEKDLDKAARDVRSVFPDYNSYRPEIQLALLDMVFNLGIVGFKKFKKTIALVKERRFEDAAVEARDSDWAKQVPNRARRVTALLEGTTKL